MELDATYPYTDEHGTFLYEVRRYWPKAFRVVDADGSELADFTDEWGNPHPDHPQPLVLYNLPAVVAARQSEDIWVVEGEKDATTLIELGFVATTMPGGTRLGWRDHYSEWLRDRCVVVLHDADGPGHRHADAVKRSLEGVAASVTVVDVFGGKRSNLDVTDWLNQRGSKQSLLAKVESQRIADAGFVKLIKTRKIDLALRFRGSTHQRFLLLIMVEFESNAASGGYVELSVADIATKMAIHRVTAQNLITGLLNVGVLSRQKAKRRWAYAVSWSRVACLSERPSGVALSQSLGQEVTVPTHLADPRAETKPKKSQRRMKPSPIDHPELYPGLVREGGRLTRPNRT